MERSVSRALVLLPVVVVALTALMVAESAVTLPRVTLTRQYYKKLNTCENVEAFVKHQVLEFMKKDSSVAPKLARLLYTDCFVTGCDASILLDGEDSEKKAPQNVDLGAFVVIDKIKTVLEQRCPGVVSCSDILNLATRDAISYAGGPSYIIRTGRKDGFSSKRSSVDLPSPSISRDDALKYFQSKGLDVQDMTTLLGVHSLGRARCRFIGERLYNYKGSGGADPSMDKSVLSDLVRQCPKERKRGDHEGIVYLNPESKNRLNTSFYQRVLDHKAVLGVDQELVNGDDTMELTQLYARGFQDFKLGLALAMARMGEIGVLTGSSGEVRKHCRYTNAGNPYLN